MKCFVESAVGRVELDDERLAPFVQRLARLGEAPPVRLVYAATHVVMLPSYAAVPHTLGTPVAAAELGPHIDWDGTLALRHRLDELGFGIAEAMDTAQRFQIGWENALRLIQNTGAARLESGFVAGAGVDHLDAIASEDELVAGVVFQARTIQAAGGLVILLPLVWLCEQGYAEEDYVRVYGRIFDALSGPLFVHWLGAMFLPSLAGYFPGNSFRRVMSLDPRKVRGAKLSLLDADREVSLRRHLLARDQILLTGDDFHFGDLMTGGPILRTTKLKGRRVPLGDFSHGLLGIFDAIAAPASLALEFLARGEESTYFDLIRPCEALGKHLFQAPTQHYKAGLAFLSWLSGAQDNPLLVCHEERSRDAAHYLEAARLASLAGVFFDAPLAAERLSKYLDDSV